MDKDKAFWDKLNSNTEQIIKSDARKKLILAGPGTGKTTSFKKILKSVEQDRGDCLVLTFIKNLKFDLEKDLSHLASVNTFHGYCHYLLRKNIKYRSKKLSQEFMYFPKIVKIIKSDYEILENSTAPQFIKMMRNLELGDECQFYLDRSNYYDTVGYDDSVFRVHQYLSVDINNQASYRLILVDEFQDFNLLEVSFLEHLSYKSPILISGDDDQALYNFLRDSNPKFIRDLFNNPEYTNFTLPYCTRCTKVVIDAFHDVVNESKTIGNLIERVHKPFDYFPPIKQLDSEKYSKIKLVNTTVQNKNAKTNYFGRYIKQAIKNIDQDEIQQSNKEGFPTALIIGSKQYLMQVNDYLTSEGYDCNFSRSDENMELHIKDGYEIIRNNKTSNLGWRIFLEICKPKFMKEVIQKSYIDQSNLIDLLPKDFIDKVMEYDVYVEKDSNTEELSSTKDQDNSIPSITLTSFEGAKGLSAQHVFIIGLHEGDLPRNEENISDFEINKFLVALTRTRKHCHILYTNYFSGIRKNPSVFLKWIKRSRLERIFINKNYWN